MFIHLSINATRANQTGWGETQYAEGLAREIRQSPGCDAALLFRGETPPPVAGAAVVLRIVGPHLEEPVPGLPNILWMISPPNVAPIAQLARYQAVFCASRSLTAYLVHRGLGAAYLPQATEAGHFHPARRAAGTDDIPLVFVGGYAPRVDRRIVLDAVEAGFAPQIWGPGWKDVVPAALWQGERLDYAELADVSARARVVLNSHMDSMARLGFMSNRSFDALACGAAVVSDRVAGFAAPDLPELRQVAGPADLAAALTAALSGPPPDRDARMALHGRLVAGYGFGARAATLLATARRLVQAGRCATPAFLPGRPGAGPVPVLTDPAASAPGVMAGLQAAADQMLAIAGWLERAGDGTGLAAPPPVAPDRQGVIHPLMADLRQMQQIATTGRAPEEAVQLAALTGRARRVAEVLTEQAQPLGLRPAPAQADQLMVRVMCNMPLWAHGPDGFNRDGGKSCVPLWPRAKPPASGQDTGVFLHLYHDDLAPVFAARLGALAGRCRIYISTDTAAKADRIAAVLPTAEIRVFENRGRDIWPKIYGFADRHDRHPVVLHLHGKKSLHAGVLDAWLAHILDCLLGSAQEVNRILSFFDSMPRLGMVVPLPFRNVLGAAHWGANRDLARELAHRMGVQTPLPDDNGLRFPVGSMFWARTAAIRPLQDLALRPAHFPPEAGQVDGTVAHALERMLGVTCRATGHHILPVVGADSRLHVRHHATFDTNGALRLALEQGVFDA